MTATNHALTGTAIGLIIGNPLLAVPLALLSHFICDAIPHFGTNDPEKALRSKLFKIYLIIEALLCFLIVLSLIVLQPANWLLAAVCAFLAASPDLLSANRYFKTRLGKPWTAGWYSNFAHNIQWFEKPIGAVVEIAWFVAACLVIRPFL